MARIPKGRAKPTSHLRRGQPTREPYDRVLIVCEGEKTEPSDEAYTDVDEIVGILRAIKSSNR